MEGLGGSLGGLGGSRWALGSPGGPWVGPLGLVGVPLGLPWGALGVPWATLGGPFGGRVDPGGNLGDQLLRKGGLAKSLVLVYECAHLGSRRLLGGPRVGQVLDPDGRRRGK